MTDLPPGETYLSDTPALAAHAGTQPDLFLRWNLSRPSAAAVDVVVFLHGFSQSGGEMQLAEKVERSGMILAGRARPTLAMLPRGNWIRHYYYDFPALLDGGIDLLLAYGLLPARRDARRAVALDRFILAAHSGGGMPAIDIIAERSGAARRALHFRRALRPRPPLGDPLQGIEMVDRWLDARFAAEPARPGALRVPFIESQTGRSRARSARLVAPISTPPIRNYAPLSLAATGSKRRACSTRRSLGSRSPRCLPIQGPTSIGTRRRPAETQPPGTDMAGVLLTIISARR